MFTLSKAQGYQLSSKLASTKAKSSKLASTKINSSKLASTKVSVRMDNDDQPRKSRLQSTSFVGPLSTVDEEGSFFINKMLWFS